MDTIKSGRPAYAQWVRRAIGLARGQQRQAVTFFDSSVPEPTEILRRRIAAGFGDTLTADYVSAFGGGNPRVCDLLAARYGVGPRQVLCTTGATGALSLLYRALARHGDHILVETPGFDLFTDLAVDGGLEVSTFDRSGEDFALSVDQIAARLTPRTRLVVLSNLHNPSGMALDHGTLRRLAELAETRDFLVIVDEVYGDYASAAARPGPACAVSPRIVSVSSLTKIFGLGTLRCGWIVGAEAVVDRVRDVATRLEFGISNLTHALAAGVLRDDAPFRAFADDILLAARPRIATWFAARRAEGALAGRLPDDGCIFFPRVVGVEDTEAFSEWLLVRSGVIVAPGEYFGSPGHVRIGFAQTPENLTRGLAALAEGLAAYRPSLAPVAAA